MEALTVSSFQNQKIMRVFAKKDKSVDGALRQIWFCQILGDKIFAIKIVVRINLSQKTLLV